MYILLFNRPLVAAWSVSVVRAVSEEAAKAAQHGTPRMRVMTQFLAQPSGKHQKIHIILFGPARASIRDKTPVQLTPLQKPARLVTSNDSLVTGAAPLDGRQRRIRRHSTGPSR
jgi:hypothetical protein